MVEDPPTGPLARSDAGDGHAGDGHTGDGDAAPAAEAAPARKMKRSTRIALVVILVLAVGAGAAFTASYLIDAQNYVTTENAQIDGDEIAVNAPTNGTLTDWKAGQGTRLEQDQVVGRIRMQGAFVQPEMPVRAPADATVVIDSGVEGAYVAAGTQLAVAYDFSKIYVTARVDETDIDDVRPGQHVEIEVDAFPGTTLTGSVREVQGGAAGVFSLFPQSNTSGNFQKVTQVIPVEIAIDDPGDIALVPGMNVTVKIRRG